MNAPDLPSSLKSNPRLDRWVRFNADGTVTVFSGKVEIGQGIVTAIAIVAHEIPQEVGDFVILLNSGYSRAQAFGLNVISSAATLAGGVLGYFALQVLEETAQGAAAIIAICGYLYYRFKRSGWF